MTTNKIMCASITALAMALAAGAGSAHAEMTIWQVENNPLGSDSGNEWLTLINTGDRHTFDGYKLQTTNGRIAHHTVPSIDLDTCESYRVTFPKQAIDNEDDSVKLLKDGTAIYETPIIKDTKNDEYFWTNPDVAAICGDAPAGSEPDTVRQSAADTALEERIAALEAEVSLLHQLIEHIMDMLEGLLGAS